MLGTLHKIVSITRHASHGNHRYDVLARLGNVIYWMGCGGMCLCIVMGCIAALNDPPHAALIIGMTLLASAMIYAAGRAINYVLTGR